MASQAAKTRQGNVFLGHELSLYMTDSCCPRWLLAGPAIIMSSYWHASCLAAEAFAAAKKEFPLVKQTWLPTAHQQAVQACSDPYIHPVGTIC